MSKQRLDFETFKSNVCHRLKAEGDLNFIIGLLESNDIRYYWEKKWYAESFYLLAMLDYISRLNDIPLCNRYDKIRSCSLKEPLYPKDVRLAIRLLSDTEVKEKCQQGAIPEFMRFNIVESEVRDVY